MTSFKNVSNNAYTNVVNDDLNNTDDPVTFTVLNGSNFPSSNFRVTVWSSSYVQPGDDPNLEIMLSTSRTDNSFGCTRGQESTTNVAHSGTPKISLLVTAEAFTDIHTAINNAENSISDIENGTTLDPRYVNASGDTMTGLLQGFALIDTRANILATTPTSNAIAYATDEARFYVFDGSSWKESAIQFSTQTSSPNMGKEQGESRQGYGEDYISDKTLNYVEIGSGANSTEGAIRQVDGTFQIYLNSTWNDIVINFRFREDSNGSYEIEHKPIGFNYWYEISTGNSDLTGIDGKPLIRQYGADMGAYQKDLIIDGGSF